MIGALENIYRMFLSARYMHTYTRCNEKRRHARNPGASTRARARIAKIVAMSAKYSFACTFLSRRVHKRNAKVPASQVDLAQ